MKKWKPSASQRRAFAENMKSPEFAANYYERQRERAEKRRAKSQFDYASAGGAFVPTKLQHDAAFELLQMTPAPEQSQAANMVIFGYTNKEKVNHDFIHVVNEFLRSKQL
jgi:hypothetical protein